MPSLPGHPFEREAGAGTLPMPAPGSPGPPWIVHCDDVKALEVDGPAGGPRRAGSAWRPGR